jgi:predicted MPP superfamily phosphohydrolase
MKYASVAKRFKAYQKRYQKTLLWVEFGGAAAAAIYSSLRVAWAFPRPAEYLVGVFVCAFALFGVGFQTYTRHREDHTFHPLYRRAVVLSGLYVAFMTYHFCALLVCDLLYLILHRVPGVPSRDVFARIACAVAVGIVAYGYWRVHQIRIIPVRLKCEKLGRSFPYRIVHLSDLHIGAAINEKHIREMVRKVNLCHPDLIVITGDILNHGGTYEVQDQEKVESILKEMRAGDGVYGVLGNHDTETPDPNIYRFFSKCGIQMIDNRAVENDTVSLVGRTGIIVSGGRVSLDSLMKSVNRDKPVIVFDHDPKGIQEAAKCGADLVLCGHTHAGQFFPCTVFTHIIYGKSGSHGVGQLGKTVSVVSAGTGYFQTPVRIGTDNEIICIDLEK